MGWSYEVGRLVGVTRYLTVAIVGQCFFPVTFFLTRDILDLKNVTGYRVCHGYVFGKMSRVYQICHGYNFRNRSRVTKKMSRVIFFRNITP